MNNEISPLTNTCNNRKRPFHHKMLFFPPRKRTTRWALRFGETARVRRRWYKVYGASLGALRHRVITRGWRARAFDNNFNSNADAKVAPSG